MLFRSDGRFTEEELAIAKSVDLCAVAESLGYAEEGLFMPDFDVTIVYEGNIETQEWLYYEQDGMVVTLGNWLNGRLSCEQIEQLWCELIIPEQNKEQKESEE